eukprot:1966676-Alexandrium_andersonii.AAC.1
MSASLVGSEMCIRDRMDTAPPAPIRRRCRSWRLRGRGQPLQGKQGGRPVSYTHLTLPTICSV